MRRSTERILTTHAGSLPRPEHLTGLFVRRARGESVGADEIAAAGLDALRAIVPKQVEAGVDVGIVWAKLRSLRDGARIASARLF